MARRRKGKRRWIWIGLGLAVVLVIVFWPLYGNVTVNAWRAKATADTHALANAVQRYRTHMGRLPASLDELTLPATNRRGQTMHAVVQVLPTAPSTYTPYRYVRHPDGTFTISTSSDGLEIRAQ